MKPILYEANTTTFTNYGLGVLNDVVSCEVTEARNGIYELEMEYPIDGIHFEDITHSRIILAKPSDGASDQPFRIYHITKPMGGIVTISAEHISYQLGHIPCLGFNATTVAGALLGMKNNAVENCPFDFWTDKTNVIAYSQTVPASIRSRLGGTQGSLLDLVGGEYEWDKWTVKLHNHRGNDNGVVLRYGKNITDIEQEENIANTITGVVPYYLDNDGNLITLPERVVYSPNASHFPYKRTVVVDFSSSFDEPPTANQLRAKAEAYINASGVGVPTVNIKVSFVPLWQTEEYKNVAVLERVKLCDTVTVKFEKLGIEAQAKVVKTVYDVLTERYTTIEIGESKTSLSKQISELEFEMGEQLSSSDLERAIAAATNLITGGLGGHVVFNRNADGEPEEILIMDTPDTSTAVNVIRMNKNGIGFSTTGYNGPFRTAWTINGAFVAENITSGTLSGITITGNTIQGNTISGETISGSTISGTDITGGSISGTSISGGTVTGAVITNGTNWSLTANGHMTGRGVDIKNVDAQENYVAWNPNLPQMDMVSRHVTDDNGVTKPYYQAAIDYNGYRIIHNYLNLMSGTWRTNGSFAYYQADGFNINNSIIAETEYDAANDEITSRFRTDNVYTARSGDISIFNGPNEQSYSYEWRFQSDGTLALYDSSGNWLWYIDADGNKVVHQP